MTSQNTRGGFADVSEILLKIKTLIGCLFYDKEMKVFKNEFSLINVAKLPTSNRKNMLLRKCKQCYLQNILKHCKLETYCKKNKNKNTYTFC